MKTSIKVNDSYIQKIMLGNIPVQRIYQSGSIVYDIGGSEPCFEVVDTISQATGDYVDVYAWDTSKWYKKNNLNQYEEYGLMPIVDSLSNLTYYTGKLVILSTDNNEYRWTGNEWEDLGSAGTLTEYLFADPQNAGETECQYYPQYYYDNGYTFQVFFYLTPNYSFTNGYNMVGGNGGHAPIEMSFYQNGFYFDAHYPKSTPGQFNTSDRDYRITASNAFNNHKGKYLLMNIQFNRVTVEDFHTGDSIYSSGSLVTKDFHDCGTVLRIITNFHLVNGSPAHIGWIKVFDNNNVLVNDIRPAIDSSSKLYWHDSLVNADYFSNNSYSFPYHTETEGELTPPVDYDTKVAPADNVHYNTLAELELMECPWYGMHATIGENYTPYIYTENGWIKQYSIQYFTIESLVDNNEIKFYRNSDSATLYTVKVSTDNGVTWANKSCSTAGTSLCTLNTGEKVLISGNITSTFSYNYQFNGSGDFKIYGNILSLVYEDNFANRTSIDSDRSFVKLFYQTNVVDAENLILPVASLTLNCYRSMFESCTKLVKAPSLDSISSIGEYACFNMFSGCTSLTTPVNITVGTLSSTYCMNSMFQDCTSLKSAILNIGNITLTVDGIQYMFSGCTSLEDVEINYSGSLPDPGYFDSHTIFYRCFYNCTSLTRIKAMMTSLGNRSGRVQTMEWVTGVAATGTFIKNANATWDITGVNGVPTGWTIETVNP